jgi:hypothetical protein
MLPKHNWLFNTLLVVAWAYIAFYIYPQAIYLFTKTGGF